MNFKKQIPPKPAKLESPWSLSSPLVIRKMLIQMLPTHPSDCLHSPQGLTTAEGLAQSWRYLGSDQCWLLVRLRVSWVEYRLSVLQTLGTCFRRHHDSGKAPAGREQLCTLSVTLSLYEVMEGEPALTPTGIQYSHLAVFLGDDQEKSLAELLKITSLSREGHRHRRENS